VNKAIFLALLLISTSSHGVEEEFSPIPSVVEKDGKTYSGILISENDFRQIIKDKLDTKHLAAQCEIDERVCAAQKKIYEKSIDNLANELDKRNNWFSRNKGSLGMVTGFVVGAATTVAITYAIYQRQ